MQNLLILVAIVGISIAAMSRKFSTNTLLIGIGIIGLLLGFVSLQSASAGDMGPLYACIAFVATFCVFYFTRKKG